MKKRLQDFGKNLGSEAREACHIFPITMFLVVLWTMAIVLEDIGNNVVWDRRLVSSYLGFFMAGSFLIESLTISFKRKAMLEAIPAVIGAVFVYLLYKEHAFYQILPVRKGIIYWGGSHRFIIGYGMITVIISIYLWYKRSNLEFETYCIKVFQQVVKSLAFFLFISLGGMLMMSSFSFLILGGKEPELLQKYERCVIGLFLLPSLAMDFCTVDEEISRFTTRIVKYVLLPLVSGIIFVIYLYLIKMMVPFTIPSNQIYGMLTMLFVFGLFVWTLLGHFHDDTMFMRVAERIPYVFLPLLLFQGYTLGIRLMHYGMTPNRYIGIMIMIFEFLYFCIYHMRRENISVMIPVFCLMALVATWVPGINMMSTSIRNQKMILEQYFRTDIEEAPEEIWQRMYGAYVWLSEQPECQQYLRERYTDEDIEILQIEGSTHGMAKNMLSVFADDLLEKIPVEGYDYVIPVTAEGTIADSITAVNLKRGKENYCMANLEGLFQKYIAYSETVENDSEKMRQYLIKNCKYAISEKEMLYLDAISFRYHEKDKQVREYRIRGYLLKKDK